MGSPISRGTIRARVWVREPLGLKTARATYSASANRCHDERESLPVHCTRSRSLPPPNERGFPRRSSLVNRRFPSDCHIPASRLVIVIGPTIKGGRNAIRIVDLSGHHPNTEIGGMEDVL